MADGIEHFSAERNWARIRGGFSDGGTYMKGPFNVPTFRFVDGIPAEISKQLGYGTIEKMPIRDTWNERRANANI